MPKALANIGLLTAIWILLNERLDLFVLISGIIFSIIAIYFTNKVLLGQSYSKLYSLPFLTILSYLFYLFFQILKSGFSAIPKVFKGNCRVKIVTYRTTLKNQLAISLLANAITLTPGTVTIEKNGNILSILCFADEIITDNSDSAPTFAKYEKILGGIKS